MLQRFENSLSLGIEPDPVKNEFYLKWINSSLFSALLLFAQGGGGGNYSVLAKRCRNNPFTEIYLKLFCKRLFFKRVYFYWCGACGGFRETVVNTMRQAILILTNHPSEQFAMYSITVLYCNRNSIWSGKCGGQCCAIALTSQQWISEAFQCQQNYIWRRTFF